MARALESENLRDAQGRAPPEGAGVDVVIGYVEPHERPETIAQIGDLELVSPRLLTYRGISLSEMDVNAVITRKPTVALVDELAHTNAPDSPNRKRYEDIQDLLRAGINVITTVNIQHFESLYNFVEEATGVRVKERVPDEIVAQADQIVNIDLPAEDLLERLRAGKIYPQERIKAALANFFTQKSHAPARNDAGRDGQLSRPAATKHRGIGKERQCSGDRSWWLSAALGRIPVGCCGRRRASPRSSTRQWACGLRPDTARIGRSHRRNGSTPISPDTLETAQKMGGLVISLKHDNVASASDRLCARSTGSRTLFLGVLVAAISSIGSKPTIYERILDELPEVDLVVV